VLEFGTGSDLNDIGSHLRLIESSIGVNPGGWDVATPRFWAGWVVGESQGVVDGS